MAKAAGLCTPFKLVLLASVNGVLVYFADGICTPSQVSLLPPSSNAGYQNKAIFLQPVVKSIVSLLSYECFTFLNIRFAALKPGISSREGF